jgi:hypothetical protein
MENNGAGTIKNLNDFDFSIPVRTRLQSGGHQFVSDGFATIGAKGRKRKTSNYSINLSGFVKRKNYIPETVAIGKHKDNPKDVLMVFDNPKIETNGKVNAYKPSNGGTPIYVVGSRNFAMRLFELLGVAVPDQPDQTKKIRFNLKEIQGQPRVYSIDPLNVTKWDDISEAKTTPFKKAIQDQDTKVEHEVHRSEY